MSPMMRSARRALLLQRVERPQPVKAKLFIHSMENPGDLVRLALKRAGLELKEAAYLLDQDLSQFVRQLNGKEALPFGRMVAKLPPHFWRELILLLAPHVGFRVKRSISLQEAS